MLAKGIAIAQQALRCRVVCVWLLLAVSASAFGQAEQPSFGYLEGRILSIDLVQRRAEVHLEDGRHISADIGLPLPEDATSEGMPRFAEGQRVEIYFSQGPDNQRNYVVTDWIRRPVLYWLLALFFAMCVLVGGGRGLRAFVATLAELLIVLLFIVPRILGGANPTLVSLLGIGGMLILAIYFVHGLSWVSTAALFGTLVAVVVTMALGGLFTVWANLTGFGSEEAMMINIASEAVNMQGLLLAALLIGALGALTDITIVQASVVRELAHVNPTFSLLGLYQRGMNVGLDHIGSLVNTLVLAYAGAGLPLLVLLQLNDFTLARALNLELLAVEVVHTLVGSIGLILAVPLTTFVSSLMFRGDRLPLTMRDVEAGHSHALSPQDEQALQRARQLAILAPLAEEEH